MFPNLLDHPSNERFAGLRLQGSPADCSVGLIDRLSELGAVAWRFPSVALSGRRATPQLVCDGGRGAADLSGNGSYAKSLLTKNLNGATLFCSQMLPFLAFCLNCGIIETLRHRVCGDMKQQAFTDMEYSFRKKKTRREEFLEIMDGNIP